MKSLAIANHCGFLLGFIASCFVGKLIAKIMTSRSTHNSQAAEFHAMNSAAVIEILAVNSSLPLTSSSEPPASVLTRILPWGVPGPHLLRNRGPVRTLGGQSYKKHVVRRT